MSQETVIRTIAPDEKDAVLDLLDEWISRDFFARYFEHDATFREDLCLVALVNNRVVSTLQVFEKRIRVDRAILRVGGIGNVYTTPTFRSQGLASQLLKRAIMAMQRDGFDLSLLFTDRLPFYARHGWRSHTRHLVFLDPGRSTQSHRYVIRPFAARCDIEAVMDIYESYSGKLRGTSVRDRRYWAGQLRYAGNPREDFLVAHTPGAVGSPVAYARGTPLYGFYVIMEHGYLPGHERALTELVCRLHEVEGKSCPGTLTQLALEPNHRMELAARGLVHRTVEDVFWMWRVISAGQLADKIEIPCADTLKAEFWDRLLPSDGSIFWISDRF